MLPPRIFMTDRHRLPNWQEVLTLLPEGTGVIFRDYDAPDRKKIAELVADICMAQGLILSIAGDPELALGLNAGFHMPEKQAPSLLRHLSRLPVNAFVTLSVHNMRGLISAKHLPVDAVLISPVFTTNSHSDAATLGPVRFASLAKNSPCPVYALGGMSEAQLKRVNSIHTSNLVGYAAIDAFAI
jgi:thiamine monophosphate synthase